jgi:long-chain acyl-CoA synthetase
MVVKSRNMETLNNIIPSLTKTSACLEYYQNGILKKKSFQQVYKDVLFCIEFFNKLKVSTGSYIGILGNNCYEWIVIDLACLAKGFISVPFDPNATYDFEDLIQEYNLSILMTSFIDEALEGKSIYPFNAYCKVVVSNIKSLKAYKYSRDDVFTIKFTSGSTQKPKAIKAKAQSADDSIESIQELFMHNQYDKIMVFLPLYLLQHRYWIYSAILYDFNILLTSSILAFRSIADGKPTVVMGVPEFYNTLKAKFLCNINRSIVSTIKLRSYQLLNHISAGFLAKQIGYLPFKNFLGGKIRYLWTGSAALSIETLMFYSQMGIDIFQGYGMNEICILAKNYHNNNKLGSVGKLLPNKKVIFDEDGQILVKSYYEVNTQYYKGTVKDDEETFGKDGFIRTGDIGFMDKDGYLYITGRKKSLIVLSNGKKIVPQKVEDKLNQSQFIKYSIVYGTDHPYLIAIIQPVSAHITAKEIKEDIEIINKKLNREERIYDFYIVDQPFTTQNEMLTSQFKLRRNKILAKYHDQIEYLYSKK